MEKRRIIFDNGMDFWLGRVEREGEQEWSVDMWGSCAAVRFRGGLKPQTPLFGEQKYLDGAIGLEYELKLPRTDRLLAVYQHKEWWIRPAFPKSVEEIPARTQLLLGGRGKEYYAVLAVCGDLCRSDLRGEKDAIRIGMSSNAAGLQKMEDLSLVIAVGENPYLCCRSAVLEALEILQRPGMAREKREYPKLLEYFGWCTWDAFYHEVSEQKIMEKLEEFKEKGIPLGWVLIDDGWLDADYTKQKLTGLDGRKDAFPGRLSGCVRRIREEFGIRNVGVWHAVMGYWNGLQKGSEAWEALGAYTRTLPDGRILPAPEAGKAFGFYDTWHSFLKNRCGIDFVKVDGQSSVSLAYCGRETYGEACGAVQKGLNASAALHFHNSMINCMGMAPQDMWNRPGSSVSRSSDDFVPEVEGSFQEHAIQNSFNSLLQGQFFWGDWDMFWSSHADSRQNAMLRAVSGGPVYVSDPLGRTDPACIWPLIRRDGRVIRCQQPGVPSLDCLFEDPAEGRKGLKIINSYEDACVMGIFAMNQGGCQGEIKPSDFGGEEKEYLVYRWLEGRLFYMKQDVPVRYALEEEKSDIFIILPRISGHRILGILEKYIPMGGMEVLWDDGERSCVRILETGTLAFWTERPPAEICVNGNREELRPADNGLYRLCCEGKKPVLVEIKWRRDK